MRPSIRRLNETVYGAYQVLQPSMAMTTYPTVRHVPRKIPRPAYVPRNFFDVGWGYHDQVPDLRTPTQDEGRLDQAGTDGVRKVGKLVADLRRIAEGLVSQYDGLNPLTTNMIDEHLHELVIGLDAYPSPLGYGSFPRSITTSVNNVIAHGIPDDRRLDPRDIINVDITIYKNGYHGDTSATFTLPDVDNLGRELVEATKEALEVGIRACGPGMPFNGIGRAIGDFCAREGYSVNEQFSGHGIGAQFHQKPWVLHHPMRWMALRAANSGSEIMHPGDCFTIEPALVQGPNPRGFLWDDGWTMSTESGARSAQFEHQVLITEDGAEVVTR